MGLAIVGNKYRRSVAFVVGTALNIQAGFSLIPYINGHFGGAIDQILSGVIESGQSFFGVNLEASNLSPTFFTRSTGLWAGKYSINNYTPNPILFNLYELIVLAVLVALPIFSTFINSKRLSTIAKRMKNGYLIGCFVPVITSCINCMINISWVGYYEAFSITSLAISFLLIVYFFVEIWNFIEPSNKWSFFFNNEEAYLTFDCHPNSTSNTKVNIWEYLPLTIFLLLPFSLYPLSNAGIGSPIVFIVAQIILLVAYLKNLSNNEWRDDFSLFTFFKIIGTCCRILSSLILIFLWLLPETLTLLWIKILTWAFVLFYQLDLLLIIGELLSRFIYLVLESRGDVRFKEYKPIRLSIVKKAKPQKRKGYSSLSQNHGSNKIHPIAQN